MNTIQMPKSAVFWYQQPFDRLPALQKDIKTDFVVVGGGIAGLMAAYHARKRGYSVVLLEKSYCGAGASGKSSGFITPDSEWELSHFEHKFGAQKAKRLWEFAIAGCHEILDKITTYGIDCDYQKQDTLIVALNNRGFAHLKEEDTYRKKSGYASTMYTTETLKTALGAQGYCGGVQYGDTFGINPYAFCQKFKNILIEYGVLVFEDSPVHEIQENSVASNGHTIRAEQVIMCVDRWAPEISCFNDEVSYVQTILMASKPLAAEHVAQLFPINPAMVWDTGLLYTYYRLTGENRLLLGGSDILNTYTTQEQWQANRIIHKLQNYWAHHFPQIAVTFDYAWPGLIGVSKDIMPVAGFDCVYPSVYGIGAASGLPWAARLGRYSIERIVDNNTEFDEYFSPKRDFPIGSLVQSIIGKKLAFMLSHGITEFF